jgi:hypothetical protein
LAVVLGVTVFLVVPTGGCSSKVEDKQPVLRGPDNSNLKPLGRDAGKPSGATSQAPVTKN